MNSIANILIEAMEDRKNPFKNTREIFYYLRDKDIECQPLDVSMALSALLATNLIRYESDSIKLSRPKKEENENLRRT